MSENDVSAYQIISMNGCDNTENIQKFCDYINLPCLCLWDLDKVVVYDKGTQKIISFKRKFVKKKDRTYLKKNYSNKTVNTFYKSTEDLKKISQETKRNTFIWKYGTLEDAILKSAEEKGDPFIFTNMKPAELKEEIKNGFNENDRQKFFSQILKFDVIKDFIKFIDEKERKKKYDGRKHLGTNEIKRQPCIYHQTLLFFSFGILLLNFIIYMVVNYLK